MKVAVPLLFLFLGGALPAFCQISLSGKVVDEKTGIALPFVTIRITGAKITTIGKENGSFAISIHNDYKADTLSFSMIGYERYKILIRDLDPSKVLIIRLTQGVGVLDEVLIRARDYKSDSLRNRREFAEVFEYKKPIFKDVFITRDPVFTTTPVPYNKAQNTTSSIASVNLLKVADLLGKNKAPISKLQKTMLQEEEGNFVNNMFSKEKITAITSLQGDSLTKFIGRYRLSAVMLKQMNTYELVSYIKRSYAEFIKPGR